TDPSIWKFRVRRWPPPEQRSRNKCVTFIVCARSCSTPPTWNKPWRRGDVRQVFRAASPAAARRQASPRPRGPGRTSAAPRGSHGCHHIQNEDPSFVATSFQTILAIHKEGFSYEWRMADRKSVV